jgi:hypothetical protein
MMTWHDDVAGDLMGPVILKYLLIIHLRKKISRPGENVADIFGMMTWHALSSRSIVLEAGLCAPVHRASSEYSML